ncbi:MAG: dihydroorotase [Desulfobacteraceae bacterium]|nr:dihydroorotase [Desulfobacteraceae bacterium]
MRIRISGGRVIDPGRVDAICDILIENGRIVDLLQPGEETRDCEVIDASGKVVTPGWIDMHVHLREPGHEYKETVASGCQAAVAGGITAVCCMPNTDPVNDNAQVTEFILRRAAAAAAARVYPVAAVSRGLEGGQLTEFGELKRAGAVALSDDGRPVTGSRFMRRALEYAKGFDLPLISHSEDLDLAGGSMNEGGVATRLGLSGIPNAAESIMVLRDIALAELTGARVHFAHVSTAESIRAIRAAKAEGIDVTGETAPHYFTLTDEAVETYDTHAKMNPPLRSAKDRQAVREALADGTLDAIATDHAPHSAIEKDVEFDRAANGIIGLETAAAVSFRLVQEGVLSLSQLVEKWTVRPAGILGLPCGLAPGSPADITVLDPEKRHTIDASTFRSRSRNTPFDGWECKGKAVLTMVGGRVVYTDPRPQP